MHRTRTMKSLRRIEERFFKALMISSVVTVLGSLLIILVTIIWRGLPALNLSMLTQTPTGGYYLGKEGGILNAIVGSLCLVGGATLFATVIALPIALYLQIYAGHSRRVEFVRLALDVLWGGTEHCLWCVRLYPYALVRDSGFPVRRNFRSNAARDPNHGQGDG